MGHTPRTWRRSAAVAGVAATALAMSLGGTAVAQSAATPSSAPSATEQTTARAGTADDGLPAAFASAAERYDVPKALLMALGYAETRLDGHGGEPSFARGYGVMHLVDNPTNQTLPKAATLTGLSEQELRTSSAANIQGAAALLDRYADQAGLDGTRRENLGAWYSVVAQYSHSSNEQTARIYADSVYRHLGKGFSVRTESGATLRLTAQRDAAPERGAYADATLPEPKLARAGYPDAIWNPADSSNYRAGDRGVGDITAVVVHTTQGSYSGTISWFQNPSSNVSSHYVIRSEDGEVTQMVDDTDVAWHARDGNGYSLGIEHEGYVDDPKWYTDAMYESSAKVTAWACATYEFTCDREHVVGHSEVPGNDHTDPGPNWDWDKYMGLIADNAPA